MPGSEKRKRNRPPGKALLRQPQTTYEVEYEEAPTGAEVLGPRTSGGWIGQDATSARADDDEEAGSGELASSWPQLVDKRIFGLRPRAIWMIVWLVVLAAIFLQDNGQGDLSDWARMRWTLTKEAIATVIMLVVAVVYKLPDWIPSVGRWLWSKRPWH